MGIYPAYVNDCRQNKSQFTLLYVYTLQLSKHASAESLSL